MTAMQEDDSRRDLAAASNWWLNGERVIALYDDRQGVIDDGVSKRLTALKVWLRGQDG